MSKRGELTFEKEICIGFCCSQWWSENEKKTRGLTSCGVVESVQNDEQVEMSLFLYCRVTVLVVYQGFTQEEECKCEIHFDVAESSLQQVGPLLLLFSSSAALLVLLAVGQFLFDASLPFAAAIKQFCCISCFDCSL
ncbi:unnamed protein product [Vicia faba]|uniref:Uncharacterized protein n=1 Tax=Vicia faba TaxID=3906 RepID=A0AAV1AGR8_VICFA|nr:unnamed protein product [Vicia faba]